MHSDDNNEQVQIEFLPTTENETELRQRRRSSLSNRSATHQNRGIGRIVRDFWAE